MFNHAVIKSLLFMTGSFLTYNSKDKNINNLAGLAKKLPILSLLFAIGTFAIVGLPPFSGFWSKLYTLTAAADQNLLYLIIIILAVSIVEIVYYFRVLTKLYYGKQETEVEIQKPTINAYASMLILGIIIIAVGVYPDLITGLLHNAADMITDKAQYIGHILSQNLPN